MRLADFVMDFVAKQGVTHVFLVPGGGAMHLNDALVQNKDLTFVPNHHEQASSIAAEAYARINGHLGVALVTTGPGGTNAVTGVAGAWIESVPLLIVSGQVKRADMMGNSGVRQKGPQEVDIVSIVKPITKYAVTVTEPKEIRYHLEKAVHLATTGRRGPVWVDIPLDVQASPIDPDSLEGFSCESNQEVVDGLEKKVAEVLKLLEAAERPLILAGHGVRLSGAAKQFRKLYENLDVPVVTTWNALDLIESGHHLSVGRPGVVAQRPPNFAVQNCDFLLAIGARLDNVVTAYNPARFGREAKRVIVDVDTNELAKFNMPIELAIESDAKVFIENMLEQASQLEKRDRSDWHARCANWKKRYPPAESGDTEDGTISHYRLMAEFSREFPEDTLIVTGSSGLAVEFFYMAFQNKPGQRVFLTSGLGAMGYGLPAMIGAGMAYQKPFIGVESDGSMQMNLQELLTIRAFNVPVKLFIMNNDGYASIRTTQRNYFSGRYIGTGKESKLLIPDIVKVAEVMGIPAFRVSDPSQLADAIRSTLEQAGPVILDIKLKSDEGLLPKCLAMPQPDGSIISLPLEDMAPLLSRDELRENMLVPLDPASEKITT